MDPALAAQFGRLPRLDRSNALTGAVSCKVCGRPAPFFDVTDFNKCAGGYSFGASGIPVPWHRCPHCGFLFTTFFDRWAPNDFRQFIYNDDYVKVDPDYASIRPMQTADRMAMLLGGLQDAKILDYGAGLGVFAERLRRLGFDRVESYDPISMPRRPSGTFDIITCVEVIEHSPSPIDTISDMKAFLGADGCILLGESLQPPDITETLCSWWYAAPRNGHVSTFADRTLATLSAKAGMIFHRGINGPHVMRLGDRFANLAKRCGSTLTWARLGAPGQPSANGFSGVEGSPGSQFQWTTSQKAQWVVTIPPPTSPRMQIMVPFFHESRRGFAAGCVLEANGQALPTSIRERSIFAETGVLEIGQAVITLRTEPLTQAADRRALGIALSVLSADVELN